jgi:hypothetical protein
MSTSTFARAAFTSMLSEVELTFISQPTDDPIFCASWLKIHVLQQGLCRLSTDCVECLLKNRIEILPEALT